MPYFYLLFPIISIFQYNTFYRQFQVIFSDAITHISPARSQLTAPPKSPASQPPEEADCPQEPSSVCRSLLDLDRENHSTAKETVTTAVMSLSIVEVS